MSEIKRLEGVELLQAAGGSDVILAKAEHFDAADQPVGVGHCFQAIEGKIEGDEVETGREITELRNDVVREIEVLQIGNQTKTVVDHRNGVVRQAQLS